MGEQQSDNAGQQSEEELAAPDVTEAAPETDASAEGGESESGNAGDGKGWSKEGQAIFTKVTQKMADDRKATDAKLDAINESVQKRNEPIPAPSKKADDPEQAEIVDRLNKLVVETPAYKEMKQAQLNTVAAMPEKFVTGVRQTELDAVTPKLREIISAQGITDPQTITMIAKNLAYDLAGAKLTEQDTVAAKARETKKAALAKQRPIDSSAGADSGSGLTFEQTGDVLDAMDSASQGGDLNPDISL